jgi:hypothetical protein
MMVGAYPKIGRLATLAWLDGPFPARHPSERGLNFKKSIESAEKTSNDNMHTELNSTVSRLNTIASPMDML